MEISEETKYFLELNGKENTTYLNVWYPVYKGPWVPASQKEKEKKISS